MNNAPNYHKNLWGDLQGKIDSSYWATAKDSFDGGNFQDSFYAVLDYINPELRKKHGNADQTEFKVPHGSVIVNITAKNDEVQVHCPFVDISEAIKVPLLRKVTELNFYPLGLSEIKMKGDELFFQFQTSLDTCEPYKLYYSLKEICQTADQYDDDFREKFKTKNILEPKVEYLTAAQIDQAWEITNAIVSEAIEYANYFESKRWYGYAYNIIATAIKRIDVAILPQGYLKNEMERALESVNDGNANWIDRNQSGKTFLNKIIQQGKESFGKNLYITETFVPNKWRTELETVQTNTKNSKSYVQQSINDKVYVEAAMEAMFFVYDTMYSNYVPKEIEIAFDKGMSESAGKPWQEAAEILNTMMDNIVNGNF